MTEFIGTTEEVLEAIHVITGELLAKTAFLDRPAGDASEAYFRAVDDAVAGRIRAFVEMTGGDGCECRRARRLVRKSLRKSYQLLAATASATGHA